MDDWPDCIVPGCPRKCCLALDSLKCFPHTDGNEHVKRWKIEARNSDPALTDVHDRSTIWADMAAEVIRELRRRADPP